MMGEWIRSPSPRSLLKIHNLRPGFADASTDDHQVRDKHSFLKLWDFAAWHVWLRARALWIE